MEKAKISASQLFILMVLFQLGSALLVPLGMRAKQDVWLAIFLGSVCSFALMIIYYQLYRHYPDVLPTTYVQKILGKHVGKTVAFIYLLYFMYNSSRVLRDFGEMLLTFAYPDTPLFIMNALLMLVIIYTIRKGIEVLARSGELLFMFLYILAVIGFILIIFSGLINLSNLQPTLGDGLGPVLNTTFTETLYFPFGESIVFTMILPYLKHPKKAKFTMICATGLTGINLTITSLINVTVLGVDLASRSQFPLLSTVQSIQVADFLERLDVFFMLALVIGIFFKIGILFYASMMGTADLFNIKSPSRLSYPLGLVILFTSMIIASNFPEHLYEGLRVTPLKLHMPFLVLFPSFLLLVVYIKRRLKLN
ncbi:GerAB/ArcD/ProY family transporter [Priestia koreensis]|uniref:Spore gernimation protein KB n=1 Tax=Priestia koreensis TaxID=284581 RepID=A0A0M0KZI7_9BACI|nr:GerAB/ArcD/ProY family transporter [Priestia koreensis]KOO44224.1 spore gernimation protein KB [Priestia koreensis]